MLTSAVLSLIVFGLGSVIARECITKFYIFTLVFRSQSTTAMETAIAFTLERERITHTRAPSPNSGSNIDVKSPPSPFPLLHLLFQIICDGCFFFEPDAAAVSRSHRCNDDPMTCGCNTQNPFMNRIHQENGGGEISLLELGVNFTNSWCKVQMRRQTSFGTERYHSV